MEIEKIRPGSLRAADGADRAALMEQARGLLQAAAADETADERRQALFTQARNLFGRVQAACPYNFDARQGAERASSGEQLEELINEGCKLLRMPSPPPVVATAAPALARAASGGGGGPDQAAGVQERRERMRKAASCFLTAQQLDPRCAPIPTALRGKGGKLLRITWLCFRTVSEHLLRAGAARCTPRAA